MTRVGRLAAIVLLLGGLLGARPAFALTAAYLYTLSDFSGPVPYDDVRLHADRYHDEVYAVTGNTVRVYNSAGMEVYRFDVDPRAGTVFDVAVEPSGDIVLLMLSFDTERTDNGWSIVRCDYRGRPIGRVEVSGLPEALATFRPNLMLAREDGLLLVSLAQYQAVAIDRNGAFRKMDDLAQRLGFKPADRARNDIAGFAVDRRGALLISVPTQFHVYVLDPDGRTRVFGRAGSSPGSFGNVAGVAADDDGDILVADKGRGAILMFDRSLEFIGEFGATGDGPAVLTRPTELALGEGGKLYVTQAREKGVAVYRLDSGVPPGAAAKAKNMRGSPEVETAPAGGTAARHGGDAKRTRRGIGTIVAALTHGVSPAEEDP